MTANESVQDFDVPQPPEVSPVLHVDTDMCSFGTWEITAEVEALALYFFLIRIVVCVRLKNADANGDAASSA